MKAIFVVDMPKSCLECEFCGYIAGIEDGFRSCFLNKHCFEEWDAKEEYLMCPLRPLPQKNKYDVEKYATVDYENAVTLGHYLNIGRNECIDEITGEAEWTALIV